MFILIGVLFVLLPLVIDVQTNSDMGDRQVESGQRTNEMFDISILSTLSESITTVQDLRIEERLLTITQDHHVHVEVDPPHVEITQEREDRIRVKLTDVELASALSERLEDGQAVIETDNPFVTKLSYTVDETNASVIFLQIDLNGPGSYALLPRNEKQEIRILFLPKAYRILLDPGHGGKDPGAIGASGRYEKEFTLQLALKVKERLMDELHFTVALTREDDRFIALKDRALFAQDWGADAFISLHGNTYEQQISGTESYYYHPRSLEMAQTLHTYMVKGTGLPDRDLRRQKYQVLLNLGDVPGVLLEVGYMSNRAEERLMWTEDFQNRVADAIVDGLKHYFAVEEIHK